MDRLRVSENGRFLVRDGGEPFFYLGDTAWELFHRLDREDTEGYLQDRSNKGFNVIQAVVLAEHEFDQPNPYGHQPLVGNDPLKPVEEYFRHVDWIVERANELGMYVGMLPTWGDKWHVSFGKGPAIFTPENARPYGEFLGKRYRSAGVIWILGGDRPVESAWHRDVIRDMAAGLREGDGGAHLMTFHPPGGRSSAEYFHEDLWLNFNMGQSGHSPNSRNYENIARDYNLAPTKPCLDGEPRYEDHPADFDPDNGYMDEVDVRETAYWAVFAGACGHTYGCHDIWQFLGARPFPPVTWGRTHWRNALNLPGAGQMGYLKQLIECRPYLSRVPDQGVLISDDAQGHDHVQATRCSDCSHALVYVPLGKRFSVHLSRMGPGKVEAQWFDPRTGAYTRLGELETSGQTEFQPPTSGRGQDWVLVLDRL